ncbi:MAG: YeeE/YedE thiosulfate transporter family protein [Alphaproteobacteria bacterium]|jgi:hypothetical protein|nr:YeeE/YedE thiosulfate transporter family protein [Alphaproteobacteria bacterium]|tara:strand:+ start:110 stop:652 length:543 start_codon:yes stop_codon:yes gene_type:complete
MTSVNGREGFRADFRTLFVEEWSPYLGAVAIICVVMVLMASGFFWGVFGGLRLWGDWFNELIGLNALMGNRTHLDNPLIHRISLMDITLVLGALVAALVSRQFRLNRPPPIEYLWGAIGGILMGVGATLAGGCTVGGFFTPLVFSSAAGWGTTYVLSFGFLLLWYGLVHYNESSQRFTVL